VGDVRAQQEGGAVKRRGRSGTAHDSIDAESQVVALLAIERNAQDPAIVVYTKVDGAPIAVQKRIDVVLHTSSERSSRERERENTNECECVCVCTERLIEGRRPLLAEG
jgi:hypothetical protein